MVNWSSEFGRVSEVKAVSHLLLFLNYRLLAASGHFCSSIKLCRSQRALSFSGGFFLGLSSVNFFSTELLSVGVPGEAADVSNAATEAKSQGHPKSRPFASPE